MESGVCVGVNCVIKKEIMNLRGGMKAVSAGKGWLDVLKKVVLMSEVLKKFKKNILPVKNGCAIVNYVKAAMLKYSIC